jgi:hypothetical protein
MDDVWLEVDVEIRQYSREQREIRGQLDVELPPGRLRKQVAPAAVAKQKHRVSNPRSGYGFGELDHYK